MAINVELVGMERATEVTTDMQRLQQVILSYQSNALKFTPAGGRIDIIVSLRRIDAKQFLEVEVRDTGCGISEANQQKLFKLFGYLNATSELNTQGIGLGLYITKMIVE